jgi:hypothetical protein
VLWDRLFIIFSIGLLSVSNDANIHLTWQNMRCEATLSNSNCWVWAIIDSAFVFFWAFCWSMIKLLSVTFGIFLRLLCELVAVSTPLSSLS